MTIQEAIQAMKQGKKVTHRYMEPDEFIRMREFAVNKFDPSVYWLSDKYQVSAYVFWKDRTAEGWNDGWELFN